MAPQTPETLDYERAGSHAPGIPMEGMVPADKLAAPSTHSTTALRSYIPALDGVRGLAILMVMCCHFVWVISYDTPAPDKYTRLVMEAMKTGRYGVDLFFVLSGFLITGILFDAKSDKHYFRNFYARRTLRIFPLYYAVLFIVFVLLPLFMTFSSGGEKAIIRNQGWLWLYMTNIKAAFAPLGAEFWQQDKLWLGHFWSLAIEEQFYLVWPLVILLLSRRAAMGACLAMIVGAPLLRIGMFLSAEPPQGLYSSLYFTFCKLDTLALGALLALLARSPNGLLGVARFAPWTLGLSFLMLAPILFWKWEKAGFTGALGESAKLSVICLFGGSLLLVSVTSGPRQLFGWFFTLPIMRFFGKYSYGIYVFHELFAPLFNGKFGIEALGRNWGLTNWYAAMFVHFWLAFAISVGVALVSWNLLEKHMLKLKRFFEHAAHRPPKPAAEQPRDQAVRMPAPSAELIHSR